MGMFTLGKEIVKFAVSKGIPADFLVSLGKDLEKNPNINIGQRIENAYGDSITGKTIEKIKGGFTQFKEKKAMGGMMEARKKGMGLKMANGGEASFFVYCFIVCVFNFFCKWVSIFFFKVCKAIWIFTFAFHFFYIVSKLFCT